MSTDDRPLTPQEAEVMGRQTERKTLGERLRDQTVHGDVEGVENEDQTDAHHADPDEHV